MCCYDAPIHRPAGPKPADKATLALYKAKVKTRATKGAAIARAKRVGIRMGKDHGPVAFGGG